MISHTGDGHASTIRREDCPICTPKSATEKLVSDLEEMATRLSDQANQPQDPMMLTRSRLVALLREFRDLQQKLQAAEASRDLAVAALEGMVLWAGVGLGIEGARTSYNSAMDILNGSPVAQEAAPKCWGCWTPASDGTPVAGCPEHDQPGSRS